MTPLPVQWELNSFINEKLSVFLAAAHVSDSTPLIESSSTPRWLDKVLWIVFWKRIRIRIFLVILPIY